MPAWLAVTILLACTAGARAQASGSVQPYVPDSDAIVLEHLPPNNDPRVRRFALLKRDAAAAPRDAARASALARAYLDYGRDTGDARYLGRAEAVVAPWLATPSPPLDAMLVQATILQSRHRFSASRQRLQAILRRDPDNAQAWLTLASVELVQGDMAQAQRACSRLIGGDALVAAGCIAARAAVTGHAADALKLVSTLLEQEASQPPAIRAWAHGLMADSARYLGQDRRADAEFRAALQLAPGDNFLLADYADFLLDHGRAREALELTRGYAQSDTSFLRQVMAEVALGLPEAQADTRAMASRFADLEQRGDSRLYAREEARFALHVLHAPQRALQLARDDWSNQRAPEDIRIYLEAALAAGQPQSARAVLAVVAATGLEDPVVRDLARQVEAQLAAVPAARATR